MEVVRDEVKPSLLSYQVFSKTAPQPGHWSNISAGSSWIATLVLGFNLNKKKETPVRMSEPGNRSRSEFADSVDDIASLRNFYRPRGVLKTDPETHTTIGKTDATRIEIGGPVRRPI